MARVLVVDDDVTITHLLRLLLEGEGHEVLVANDGVRCLALAQRQHPDLIVLDVMMSVMSGTAALRALANDPRTSSIPIVMLSALAEEEIGGLPDGVDVAAYVRKPFKAAELVVLIGGLLPAPADVTP
jgi:CheY-like chemotaxis protein